jgi:hypothetical protein
MGMGSYRVGIDGVGDCGEYVCGELDQNSEGVKNVKKAEIIAQLSKLSDEGMEKSDPYMFDFVDFINKKVAPHMTLEGLKILKNEYQSWVDNND